MAVTCCTCMPHRYFIVMLCFFGMLISVGYRSNFALVITHINAFASPNDTGSSTDGSLFPNCTTEGTSRDRVTHWDGSTVFLFSTSYFVGQLVASIPGGAMVQKFSAKWVFGLTVLISSVLQMLAPLASEITWLIFVFRVVQGGVEAITVPSMNAVISAWTPKAERARLINFAYAGVYLSPALANFSTGACLCYVSWDSSMYMYGGAGVVWTIIFLLFVYPTPLSHPKVLDVEEQLLQQQAIQASSTNVKVLRIFISIFLQNLKVPWKSFFTSLPVLAIWVGAFCRNFIFAMLITEIQQYYKDVYSLSSAMNGLLNGLPHIFMGIFMIFGSFIFDFLAKNNILSMTKVRKLAQGSGFGIQGACILAIGFLDNHIHVFVLFCVGVAFSGFAISGYQTNPLDLAPQYAGPLTGISRTGMLGSIISTVLASRLTGSTHSLKDWQILFIIGGSLHLAGVVFYSIFASGSLQPWAKPEFQQSVEAGDEESSDERSALVKQSVPEFIPSPTYGAFSNDATCTSIQSR
ncbi:vesicular glutamate transporter 2-like [Physella acuta]|uniref:vesicular glutamate transporter 2-like n=1 Tax=Physella acuta TaxID=109671 RepID=UPI0027DE5EDB|nr:vesicular glutamate transporter 2-like [Physella acuta]